MARIAQLTPDKGFLHSRIALLPESGGKTRTIAIGDYWSQAILKPLHNSLMGCLRKLETDGTWNQDFQSERIKRLANNHSISFDLTNATDRFPVEIQRLLISELFGEDLSVAWVGLMTDRTFSYKQHSVRWGRGQPLGFYSSWAAFALAHHAVIEYCAFKIGVKSFRDYAVLGDDVVI